MHKSKSEFVVEIYQNDKLIYEGEGEANKYIKAEYNNFPPLFREISREGKEGDEQL